MGALLAQKIVEDLVVLRKKGLEYSQLKVLVKFQSFTNYLKLSYSTLLL